MATKRNAGQWTESRYRTFITSALRGGFRRWPPKFKVLRNAATERRINPRSGKLAMHYRCAGCGNEFPQKEVQVDHKKPIVDPKKGFISWDIFIERLYCEASNLQVLCKTGCHKKKSAKERKQRDGRKRKQRESNSLQEGTEVKSGGAACSVGERGETG